MPKLLPELFLSNLFEDYKEHYDASVRMGQFIKERGTAANKKGICSRVVYWEQSCLEVKFFVEGKC